MRVVGVVNDVKHAGLEWDVLPETFVPYTQVSGAYGRVIAKDISVAMRGRTDMSSVRATLSSLDGRLPIFDITSADDLVSASADRPRFRTWLISAFAAIALALASIGLYGVLSQAVVQRQEEIAIRIALGATSYDVIRQVLRPGLTLAALGVSCGIVGTLAAGRIVTSLLYGVGASDIRVLAVVVVITLVVATLASLISAKQATAIDPVRALRGL